MTRVGYEIVATRAHVDDTDERGEGFSRDCPEFTVTTDGEAPPPRNHF